jgi:hypothetical protein
MPHRRSTEQERRRRVIYFYLTAAAQIRLIAIYKKGVTDDLNDAEKKALKKPNESWWEARCTRNCLPIW